MSYDTSIRIDTGANCLTQVSDVGNYTSNIYPMYHLALPNKILGGGLYDGEQDGEPRTGLPGLSGLLCSVAAEELIKAIAFMKKNKEKMLKLNPDNGWGDYHGAIKYLRNILNACEEHPNAILTVNW